ncbi:sodium-translocating pyrophosphatase, partial [Candidatus Parcubacteria bacterium]
MAAVFSNIWFPVGSGALAVIAAIALASRVLSYKKGSAKMEEIARAIQEGARAYLRRQYLTIGVVAVVIAAVIGIFLNVATMAGFLVGAVASGLAGYIGMSVSVRANVKTAEAARKGLPAALRLAFFGGSVTGLLVAGLALLSVTVFYLLTHDVQALVGLGFGGSLISV